MARGTTSSLRSVHSASKQRFSHRHRLHRAIADIEPLENRLLFSFSSTILSGVFGNAGNSWTYQGVNTAGTVDGTTTYLAKGTTTFQGHNAFELQTNISTSAGTTTTSDYFAATSAGLIDYGNVTSTTIGGQTDTSTSSFTPVKVLIPSTLSPGVPVTETWNRTDTTTIDGQTSSTTRMISFTFTLAAGTTSVTVPAGTYDSYEVDATEVDTPTIGTATTSFEQDFFSQNVGLVQVLSGPIGSPTNTLQLAAFTPAGNGGGGGGGGGGSTGTTSPTSSLTPTLTGSLPSSVIAGQKAKISQNITITNSGSGVYDSTATGSLFLSTGTTITSDSLQLPETISKKLKLKTGAHFSAKFALKALPSTVPDGTYHLIAEVTDSSGNTTASASSGTITVAPPEVTLTGSFSKFASTAVAGKKIREIILVSNTAGNEAADGVLPIDVDISPDGLISDATPITQTSRKINLKQAKSISIAITLTASAAMNDDFLIVQLDPANTLHSLSTTGEVIVSPVKLTVS